MSKSIPNRTRSPAVEGATLATSRRAVEQFRLHLLERIPDAARVKLRSISSVEAASGNGLRELWEKSDLRPEYSQMRWRASGSCRARGCSS